MDGWPSLADFVHKLPWSQQFCAGYIHRKKSFGWDFNQGPTCIRMQKDHIRILKILRPCQSLVEYKNSQTPSMHHRLGPATLSQLAFPRESKPNFPWEIFQRDDTAVNKNEKIKTETITTWCRFTAYLSTDTFQQCSKSSKAVPRTQTPCAHACAGTLPVQHIPTFLCVFSANLGSGLSLLVGPHPGMTASMTFLKNQSTNLWHTDTLLCNKCICTTPCLVGVLSAFCVLRGRNSTASFITLQILKFCSTCNETGISFNNHSEREQHH